MALFQANPHDAQRTGSRPRSEGVVMPHPICKHCNMIQPLVVRAHCASCGKLLSEPVKLPTMKDRELYEKWLIQREAQKQTMRG
jgi:hypothetical protein